VRVPTAAVRGRLETSVIRRVDVQPDLLRRLRIVLDVAPNLARLVRRAEAADEMERQPTAAGAASD
jgi:hypothetical protein